LVDVVVGHTIMATSTLLRRGAGHPQPGGGRAAVRRRCGDAGFGGRGLKDQGLYCVAVMLVALIAARGLVNESQRVCAASLPARIT
jgi:hypothetical protein